MNVRIGMATGLAMVTTLALGLQAEAKEGRPGGHERPDQAQIFAKMDADGDGSVTKAEFKSAHAARMAKKAEQRGGEDAPKGDPAKRAERMEKRFAKLDTNGDGALSESEFAAGAGKGGPRGPGKHHHRGTDGDREGQAGVGDDTVTE